MEIKIGGVGTLDRQTPQISFFMLPVVSSSLLPRKDQYFLSPSPEENVAMWFYLDGLMAGKVIEMRIFQLRGLLDCISILFQIPDSIVLLSTQRQCGDMPSKNKLFFYY